MDFKSLNDWKSNSLPWIDWNVCNLIFSSVVVGNCDEILLRTVVISGILSIIGCSLLASVLLSAFKIIVIGTNLTVVVSNLGVVIGLYVVVTFWCWTVFTRVGFDNSDPFVELIVRGVDVNVEWNALAVVDVIAEPNEKCGIVFWSILFSTISDSAMSLSS